MSITSLLKSCAASVLFCLACLSIIQQPVLALDRKTSFALSHYIMAGMHNRLGNIDRAIEEYQKALKADPKSILIHLNLAASFIKKNDTSKAIEELKIATRLDPQAVEPHAILALLYSSLDQPDLATEEYEMALKNASRLQPKNIDIYKSLGLVYLRQKKYAAAENTYRLILDLAPEDSQAHFYLANVYDNINKRTLAVEHLKKAITLKPDYGEALNYLGYLYVEEKKNLNEAETMIRKALQIEPDNGAYVDSLGWLYFQQGRFKEALTELERASTLLDDPVIYDHLGDVYFKLNDLTKAKDSWKKSLKLDFTQEKVKEKLEKCK